MAKEGRGLICLAVEGATIDRLQLPLMADPSKSTPAMNTAFTVSIEARQGISTGISAQDRAKTIQVAIDDQSTQRDIVVPGHVFPLRARDGGVLERAGHTEGAVDLTRLAGRKPAGVICEIMCDDGTMARLPELIKFSEKHDLPIVTIEDLISHRLQSDSLCIRSSSEEIHNDRGSRANRGLVQKHLNAATHFALIKGNPAEYSSRHSSSQAAVNG